MDQGTPEQIRTIFDDPPPEHASLARHILPRYLEWYHTLRINISFEGTAAGLHELFPAVTSPRLPGALCAQVSRSELLRWMRFSVPSPLVERREMGVRLAGLIGSEADIPALEAVLGHEAEAAIVRLSAAVSLLLLGRPVSCHVEAVCRLVADAGAPISERALWLLAADPASLQDDRVMDAFLEACRRGMAFRDPHFALLLARAAASGRDVPADLLYDFYGRHAQNPEVLSALARAFCAQPAPEDLAALIGDCVARGDDEVTELILLGMMATDAPERWAERLRAVLPIEGCPPLEHHASSGRAAACYVCASEACLRGRLGHADDRTRAFALLALARRSATTENADLMETVRGMSRDDPGGSARWAASLVCALAAARAAGADEAARAALGELALDLSLDRPWGFPDALVLPLLAAMEPLVDERQRAFLSYLREPSRLIEASRAVAASPSLLLRLLARKGFAGSDLFMQSEMGCESVGFNSIPRLLATVRHPWVATKLELEFVLGSGFEQAEELLLLLAAHGGPRTALGCIKAGPHLTADRARLVANARPEEAAGYHHLQKLGPEYSGFARLVLRRELSQVSGLAVTRIYDGDFSLLELAGGASRSEDPFLAEVSDLVAGRIERFEELSYLPALFAAPDPKPMAVLARVLARQAEATPVADLCAGWLWDSGQLTVDGVGQLLAYFRRTGRVQRAREMMLSLLTLSLEPGRITACCCVVRWPDPAFLVPVAELLAEEDPDLRVAAAAALEALLCGRPEEAGVMILRSYGAGPESVLRALLGVADPAASVAHAGEVLVISPYRAGSGLVDPERLVDRRELERLACDLVVDYRDDETGAVVARVVPGSASGSIVNALFEDGAFGAFTASRA